MVRRRTGARWHHTPHYRGVIFEDKISSLKRFKDDAKEVAQGYECGVGLEKFNDIKEGDIIEAFVMEEIPQ